MKAWALAALLALPSQAEDGFVPLFNGKDLTGWRYGNEKLDGKTETADKRFQVVDGVIVAHEKDAAGRGGIRDLWTAAEYDRDFRLKLEFRAGAKSDSGVYIRGPQLQVRDFPRLNQQKQLTKFKTDDWNELDITVQGRFVSATVNGKTLSPKDAFELVFKDGTPQAKLNGEAVDVSQVQVSAGSLAQCLLNGEPLAKDMRVPVRGPVGLQAETGKFEFRNVRLKPLP